jgi:eukaryotic-like serine/threonine-protein kinase
MVDLAEGAILNETYKLIRHLGRGGMGEVWCARHLRLPKEVALKVLNTSAQANPEAVARFRREAEITSQLGHPNIVEILDFNTLPDERSYIVMELLRGESLRQRLNHGRLQQDEVLTVLQQIASALVVAHRAGVVHRDLKPENVFLTTREGTLGAELWAKILDFGISKIQGNQSLVTREQAVLGTPSYMSPEQAKGQNKMVDARTDQYALATIAYELFSGHCAFAGDTVAEVVYKVVFEPPTPLEQLRPDLPRPMTEGIKRAMAKAPEERFPDVVSFISSIQVGLPTVGDPGKPPEVQHHPQVITGPGDPQALDMTLPLPGLASVVPAADLGNAATLDSGSLTPSPAFTSPSRASASLAPQVHSAAVPDDAGGTSSTTRPFRKPWHWLLVVLGVAGLWGGSRYFFNVAKPAVTTPAPVALDAAPRLTVNVRADAAQVGDRARLPDMNSTRSAPDTAKGNSPVAKAPSTKDVTKSSAKPAPLPLAARQDLEGAEQALQREDYPEAFRLAKHSLTTQETIQAYMIMAKVYCKQHDLGMAQAMVRRIPRNSLRTVRTFCQRVGMNL